MQARIPAAQYQRMSTEQQMYSLANQDAAIAAYAQEHGFEIIKTYCDAGKSGITTKGRNGLKSLLADVLSGAARFNTILVLDVSRWGRFQDPDEAAHYEFICKAAGIQVIYCAEVFERGPTGSIVKQLKRVMAGEYSRELSAKVRRGKWRQAESGHALGGVVPFGFRRQVVNSDGTLGAVLKPGERKGRPDQEVVYVPGPPEELQVLRTIFRLYVKGRVPPVEIAARLNKLGMTWKDGASWNKDRVHKALNCGLAGGAQVFNKTRVTLGKIEFLARENWIYRPVTRPVISPKIFRAARRRAAELGGRRLRTDQEMEDDLRLLLRKHGHITDQLLNSNPHSLRANAYRDRFGSVHAAYQRIGYQGAPRAKGSRQNASRDEIIAGMQRLSRQAGWISFRLIDQDRLLPSRTYIEQQFGSMREAYAAAGLNSVSGTEARRKTRSVSLTQPSNSPTNSGSA